MKVHRYLIQETLNGPEPDPEYHDCWRCGIGLKPNSLLKGCEDCNGLNQHKANPSQRSFFTGPKWLRTSLDGHSKGKHSHHHSHPILHRHINTSHN